MADGAIDSLSIEIGASSTKAVEDIGKIVDSMKELKAEIKGLGNLSFGKKLGESMSALAGSMKAVKSEDISKLRQVSSAMKTFEGVKEIRINSKFAQNMADIAAAVDLLKPEHIDGLTKFGSAMQNLNGVKTTGYDKLPPALLNIAGAVDNITDDTITRIHRLTLALGRLKGVDLRGVGSVMGEQRKTVTAEMKAVKQPAKKSDVRMAGGETARGVVMSASEMSDEMWNALSPAISLKKQIQSIYESFQNSKLGKAASAFAGALKIASNYASKLSKNIASFAKKRIKIMWDKSAFGGLEKSLSRIKNVINSFSRIAFYRAIRSAIKYVTDSLKEGVENAYHYSKEFGDATGYIADAYDRISSSEFKMSNQLGAAWATMIAYIEPIIIKIINLVTRAADAVTQFFAIMSGKGTYLKAVDYNKEWAESATGAAKAAKEWKNQLMGFDEINRLEEPSDGGVGGGGKAGLNYGDMFEETAKNLFFEQLRDAFENGQWALMGQLLGDKFNEIVDMVDWKKYGKKIGEGLNASITVAYNFLKTADFKNLGERLSEFINSALDQVNFDQAGRTWMRLRLSLLDFLLGLTDGLDWSMLAVKLSDFVIGSLNELSEWISTLDPAEIAKALKDFFGNIKYTEIGQALYDVLKEAVDFAVGVLDELGLDGKTIKAIVEIVGGLAALILAIKGVATVVGTVKIALGLLTSPIGLVVIGITALIAAGVLLYKNWDKIKETATAVFGPLLDDIKRIFGGIKEVFQGLIDFVAGVFTGDWSRAWDGVKEIFGGVLDVVIGDIQIMFDWIKGLIGAVADALSWLQGLWDGMNQIAERNARWNEETGNLYATDPSQYIPRHSTGGFPEDGLFYANHGELVGKFTNGRTAVANNEMIVEGISAGVFNAVVAAFSQTGGGGDDRPVNIYLDGRQIAQTTTKYQNQFARASGA